MDHAKLNVTNQVKCSVSVIVHAHRIIQRSPLITQIAVVSRQAIVSLVLVHAHVQVTGPNGDHVMENVDPVINLVSVTIHASHLILMEIQRPSSLKYVNVPKSR